MSSPDHRPDDKVVALPSSQEIEAEAAAWLTVLGRQEVADSERAQFARWLGASDRHRAAFEELAALWDDLEILKELDDIAQSMADEPPQPRPVFRQRSFVAIAASLALLVAVGGLLYANQQSRLNQHATFATAVGEQRTIELADGSRIQLNTGSRVEVAYTSSERIVRLTAGETYFDVDKEPRRPFSVYAADGIVRAVGTAFTVRLRDNDAVEVTVEEGRVAIASVSPRLVGDTESTTDVGEPTPMVQLTAGQSAVFDERVDEIEHMDVPALNRKLSWRQGMLAYSGDRLADVIADISRYTDVQIEISDPALGEKRVAGYFRIGEVEALFDSLELSFGLEVERVSDKRFRLSEAS